MINKIAHLIAPQGSKRGKMLRGVMSRFRHRRATQYSNARYNLNRQNYYNHSVTKTSNDQKLKVSIIVPCYNTPKKYFEPLLASIFAQGYENWELILIDASNSSSSSRYLKNKALADFRIQYIKTENEGIAINTNKGILQATGELIAFLDHDDTLDHDALAESVEMFTKHPSLGLVYSDEDKISDDGEKYFEPHFKPDFSIDMLRNVNYITHFVVVRKSIVDKLKGIRTGFDGAQDYDLLLRVVDEDIEIGHVPKILYHWRQANGSTAADFSNKSFVTDAGCKALTDHYKRQSIKGVKVEAIKNRPGFYKPIYELDNEKRYIVVNLSGSNLTRIEKDYILKHYMNNRDVKKYNIAVLESKPNQESQHLLIVNGAFIPAKDTTDIASLFGLASEPGVAGVSPKIVRHGRIFDMGIVNIESTRKYLFKGLNPDRSIGFGSVEWVRNVDELTRNVGVYSKENIGNNQRNVVWSHSEFVSLVPKIEIRTDKKQNYYNPNVVDLIEMVEEEHDYITDLVEIKK